MIAITNLEYAFSLIVSTGKKSFVALGNTLNKSRHLISKLLPNAESNFNFLEKLAIDFFKDKKELVLAIDDTLIKKIYSTMMHGSGFFYDTKIGRTIRSYRLLCSAITDGKYILPIKCIFLFDSKLSSEPITSKDSIVKNMILAVKTIFPDKNIIVAADGAFAGKELLGWAIENQIFLELRMHSNRKVKYKGKSVVIRNISELMPKGRHMARTIEVLWHEMKLYITAQRRINKHSEETIVYQAATYQAKPSKHVAVYKKRWPIEKMFRTTKGYLGLEDCYSTSIDMQLNHISSVLTAYAIAQVECKNQRLDCVEDAIRALKSQNYSAIKSHIDRLDKIFEVIND